MVAVPRMGKYVVLICCETLKGLNARFDSGLSLTRIDINERIMQLMMAEVAALNVLLSDDPVIIYVEVSQLLQQKS